MRPADIPEALRLLEQKFLFRKPDDQLDRAQLERRFGKDFIDAASNDYLGLAGSEPRVEVLEPAPVQDSQVSDESLSSGPTVLSEALDSESVSRETLGVNREAGGAEAEGSSLSLSTVTVSRETPGVNTAPGEGGGGASRRASALNLSSEIVSRETSGVNIQGAPSEVGGLSRESEGRSVSGASARSVSGPSEEEEGTRREGSRPGGDPETVSRETPGVNVAGELAGVGELSKGLEAQPFSGASGRNKVGEGTTPDDSVLEKLVPDQVSNLILGSEVVSRETPGVNVSELPSAFGGEARNLRSQSVSRETPGVNVEESSRLTAPLQHLAPVGAGASRLIFGTHPEHLEVEEMVANWLKMPASLLFSSGYAANVGALSALLSAEDAVFSDALNHASLIDGIRLSPARARVFPHLDLDELEKGLKQAQQAPARWVVVESYYSMDGDGPDLKRLREICDRWDAALYVDEAHSIGCFGSQGAGLCEASGVKADVVVAAFGKSVGAQAACVASSTDIRAWLWNRARSFVFSTAPSPLLTQALAGQLRRVFAADEERARLLQNSLFLRAELHRAGAPLVEASFGPVLGLLIGPADQALKVAEALRAQGVLAQAVRPPTVPEGESRVRLVLRASLQTCDLRRLAKAVISSLEIKE